MARKVQVKKSTDPRYKGSPWIARWRDPDGRRRFKSFPTKSMASDFANLTTARINTDIFKSVASVAWDELVDDFIESKKAAKLAPNTIYQYRAVYRDFGKVNHSPQSARINVRHIDEYKKHIQGKSAASINKELRSLNCLFNWSTERNYMAENPIRMKSAKVRERKKRPRSLTPDQFHRLMDYIVDDQWRILVHLGINGVGRKRSLMALKISDVDFENDVVRSYDTKQKEYRACPLHPESMKILTDYVNDLPTGQTKLFISKFHHTVWNRFCEKAGIKYTFHHLRTCAASWLKARGVSDSLVSRIQGRSVQGVTETYYTDLDDVGVKRDGVALLPLTRENSPSNR
jgi:integrase